MITTLITLVTLLISILFIKSVTIVYRYGNDRRAKVNLLFIIIVGILAFVPVAKWFVLIGTPLITIIWYTTDMFERKGVDYLEIRKDSVIGKIILFKI